MESKELIKRTIEFNNPERIGFNFNPPYPSDILWIRAGEYIHKHPEYKNWGRHKELLKKVPFFSGEVQEDVFGNIIGRLNEKTKGETVKGVLEDDWELLDGYKMPEFNHDYKEKFLNICEKNKEKFILGVLPESPFSCMREMRKMENFMMDTVINKNNVLDLLVLVKDMMKTNIKNAAEWKADGVCIYEDWGTQTALLISPEAWREIFKPVYKEIIDYTHSLGMKFFMHSCGYVYEIIGDLIEVGVDVLQFDQPQLVGVNKLASDFGGKVTFWCPVDIQKIMATGNKKLVQDDARKMLKVFKKFKGGFIAKDYPTWEDINVKPEWAKWARDIFLNEGNMIEKETS